MPLTAIPTEDLIRSAQRNVDESLRLLADLLDLVAKSRAAIEESKRRIEESEALILRISGDWVDPHEGE